MTAAHSGLREQPSLLRLPESPPSRTAPADLLTSEEARALVKTASHRAPTGIRNRALIVAMYRSGLRPGEALALLPTDVDLGERIIAVPARKGGAGRAVGVDETACDVIIRWAQRRSDRGLSDEQPLFCTLAGAELKAAYVRELLPRLARKAGIDKRVHPLGLRYTNAAELTAEGFPTALIDRHLGVAVTRSVRRYQPDYPASEVVRAVAQREWQL